MTDAGPESQPPAQPGATRSGWSINWRGALALVLVVSTAWVAWRWLGGSAVDSGDGDQRDEPAATSPPATTASPGTRSTTRPSPSTTLPAPSTTSSTTTTVAPERQVLVSGEMKPCRFGGNCLVASFTIDGFDEHPGRFACVYPNSRSDFGFNDNEVLDACMSADAGDTITIEVDGVRSATISEQNLDGT